MTNEHSAAVNRIHNWALATGTEPGRRAASDAVVVSRLARASRDGFRSVQMTRDNGAIGVGSSTPATGTQSGTHAVRRVMVISRHADQRVLETVLSAGNYDVVFMESPAHAYSQVKCVVPNLVIVCLSLDDVESFRVLAMLQLDSATSRIPVVTYITGETSGFTSSVAA